MPATCHEVQFHVGTTHLTRSEDTPTSLRPQPRLPDIEASLRLEDKVEEAGNSDTAPEIIHCKVASRIVKIPILTNRRVNQRSKAAQEATA